MPYESGETGSIVSGPRGVRHELKVVTGMQCLQFTKVFASGESDIIGNQCTVANDEYRLQRRFAIGDCQHRMRSQRNRNKRTQWAHSIPCANRYCKWSEANSMLYDYAHINRHHFKSRKLVPAFFDSSYIFSSGDTALCFGCAILISHYCSVLGVIVVGSSSSCVVIRRWRITLFCYFPLQYVTRSRLNATNAQRWLSVVFFFVRPTVSSVHV